MTAAEAVYASGQPLRNADGELLPVDTSDVKDEETQQAFHQMLQTVVERDSQNESAEFRRMRQLELELQLTDDPAKQESLALEIAKLRRTLRKSGQ